MHGIQRQHEPKQCTSLLLRALAEDCKGSVVVGVYLCVVSLYKGEEVGYHDTQRDKEPAQNASFSLHRLIPESMRRRVKLDACR